MSKIKVSDIDASGTRSSTTYLSGDGTFSTPAGGPSPVVRGTSEYNSGGNSAIVPLPSGAIAGDLAVLFGGTGWSVNNPSGWGVLYNDSTGIVSAGAFWKILDAADITAGSVTLSFTNSFDSGACLVVIEDGTFDAAAPIFDSGGDKDTSSPITPTTSVGGGNDLIITAAYERMGGVIGYDIGTVIEGYNSGSRSEIMLSDQTGSGTYTVTFTPGSSNGILGVAIAISPAPTGSSGVDLEQGGVPVTGGPFDTLNFSGSGVGSITDAGGGTADIVINTGGGAYRPMVDGSLPPNLMYAPDGTLIMEPFTP